MYNLQNIKTIAERKKTTIREIAVFCGVSDTGLHKSIKKNSINIDTLYKIAEYLNISVSELISDKRLNIQDVTGGNEGVYKKLVSTQEELIRKQEKMYNSLEKENRDLKKQIEELKNEVQLGRGYNVAAEPSVKLKK